jgi:prophage regulatory protein
MTQENQNMLRILRRKQVESRTGLSRSTIYARIAEGSFPSPIDLGGGRAVGWVEAEIEAWLQSRIEASRKSVEGGAR